MIARYPRDSAARSGTAAGTGRSRRCRRSASRGRRFRPACSSRRRTCRASAMIAITRHDAEADDHVQRVQPGHHEVEREEHLARPADAGPRNWKCGPGHDGGRANLSVYSIALMPRNTAPSTIVDDEPDHLRLRRWLGLRRAHRQRHRQRADDQDGGVDARPSTTFELMAGLLERLPATADR